MGDNTMYKVVINHEDKYSVWPADRENNLGWNDVGKQGSLKECTAYIEEMVIEQMPEPQRQKMEMHKRRTGGGEE